MAFTKKMKRLPSHKKHYTCDTFRVDKSVNIEVTQSYLVLFRRSPSHTARKNTQSHVKHTRTEQMALMCPFLVCFIIFDMTLKVFIVVIPKDYRLYSVVGVIPKEGLAGPQPTDPSLGMTTTKNLRSVFS